ncbi:MAG: histidine triad nucleotide-binding protein [Betaproteobacteria bacterium]|nr:histidine triad nucleotide-binding protein [Betaproteobacteria bacterium]
MEDCIFCNIIAGKIPCNKVYEDEDILAFHDIRPVAPVHFMVIPKPHIASLAEVDLGHQLLLGKMLALASKLAIAQGCGDGWRTVINTGRVGRQEVYHLHIHIIGGKERLPAMIKR